MNRDPYRYFRIEAHELLDQLRAGLRGWTATGDEEGYRALLRHAHTLKGASRVVGLEAVASVAHELEDAMARLRGEDGVAALRESTAMVEDLAAMVAAAVAGEQPGAEGDFPVASGAMAGVASSASVDRNERTGDAHETERDLAVRIAELRQGLRQLDLARDDDATGADPQGTRRRRQRTERLLDRALVQAEALAELAERQRLARVRDVFDDLERGIEDAASVLGRAVEVRCEGGSLRMDRRVLMRLRDAMVQVVRNAVAHGIEAPSERAAAGKAPTARIDLTAEVRGDRVVLGCCDDGRGVDPRRVAAAARSAGLIDDAAALGLDVAGACELLLRPGLTTRSDADHIAGRGVGLDLARSVVHSLGGDIRVESRAGRGLSVSLSAPLSLYAARVVEVEAGGCRVGLPVAEVERLIAVPVGRDWGDVEDAQLPRARLASLLGEPITERRCASVAVLRCGDHRALLGVEAAARVREVVVAPLPPALRPPPWIVAAERRDDGIMLVLGSASLLDAIAAAGEDVPTAEPARDRRRRVLVVDDSLTTRMLEQSILEVAGYDVTLAVHAEDAMAQLERGDAFDLLLVDIEMPGRSGIDLLVWIRARPETDAVPVIMVSSLDDPDARRRAEEAGAQGYIVKGRFDQRELLDRIAAGMG